MAYVPDEAVKCGREISLAARSLYQIYCAYRNRMSGICALKNNTRIAEESGLSRTYVFKARNELLVKNWITIDELDNVSPVKGKFDKLTVAVEIKEVNGEVSDKSTLSVYPTPQCQLIRHRVSDKQTGTEVAIKGNILLTNNKTTNEEPPAPENAAKADDLIWIFRDEFQRVKKLPYRNSVNDQVAIVTMQRFYNPSVDDWKKTLKNYFATPNDRHWIGDLCEHYDTYFASALDRYRKPVISQPVTISNGIEIPPGYFMRDGKLEKRPAL